MPLPLPLTLPSNPNPRADVDGDIDDADVEFETAVAAVPGLFLFTLPFWKCPRPLGFGLLTTVPLMVGMELELEAGDTFDDVLPIFDGTCILLLTPMTVRPLPLELDLDRVREVLLLKFSVLLKTSIFRVLVRLACLTCSACSRGRYFSVRLDERTSERET